MKKLRTDQKVGVIFLFLLGIAPYFMSIKWIMSDTVTTNFYLALGVVLLFLFGLIGTLVLFLSFAEKLVKKNYYYAFLISLVCALICWIGFLFDSDLYLFLAFKSYAGFFSLLFFLYGVGRFIYEVFETLNNEE